MQEIVCSWLGKAIEQYSILEKQAETIVKDTAVQSLSMTDGH